MSSARLTRSASRSQAQASRREEERVNAVLQSRSLAPHEPNGVNDMQRCRRDIKKCLQDRYSDFDRIGLVDDCLLDNQIDLGAGERRQDKQFKWNQYINGYALATTEGTLRPRSGDVYTCHAAALCLLTS